MDYRPRPGPVKSLPLDHGKQNGMQGRVSGQPALIRCQHPDTNVLQP